MRKALFSSARSRSQAYCREDSGGGPKAVRPPPSSRSLERVQTGCSCGSERFGRQRGPRHAASNWRPSKSASNPRSRARLSSWRPLRGAVPRSFFRARRIALWPARRRRPRLSGESPMNMSDKCSTRLLGGWRSWLRASLRRPGRGPDGWRSTTPATQERGDRHASSPRLSGQPNHEATLYTAKPAANGAKRRHSAVLSEFEPPSLNGA